MFEDLGKLINAIQRNYDRICSKWSQMSSLQFNLKKTQVIDVHDNSEILDSIWTYKQDYTKWESENRGGVESD